MAREEDKGVLEILHRNWVTIISVQKDVMERGLHNIYIRPFLGNFLEVQWLELQAFTVRAQAQSQVGELKSRKPCGSAKEREKTISDLKELSSSLTSLSIFSMPYGVSFLHFFSWERIGPGTRWKCIGLDWILWNGDKASQKWERGNTEMQR